MATTQYVIDIAASMPAGEKTIAQLDDLTRQLLASGAGADALHDAVATAANALASAKDASVAANAALAEGNAEFARLERAAIQAGKAQEKAAQLGVVPPDVAASLATATADLEAHTTRLRGLEAAAAGAKANEDALARTLTNVKQAATAGNAALAEQERVSKEAAKAAEDAAKKAAAAEAKAAAEHEKTVAKQAAANEKASKAAEELTGTNKFRKLTEALDTTQGQAIVAAGAFAALATAVVVVTVALAAATVALLSWSVGLADANRAAALHQSAVAAMRPEVALLSGAYEKITDDTGQSADALNGFAKGLKAAKVSLADMPGALAAAATAETALGQGGAQEFIDQIKEGKRSVSALAAETQSKLGGIVAKQMLGLDAQSARLKKNIGDIFGGLDIEPVLGGLQTLVELFDKNTAAGRAMQLLFESVFQPIIDQAQNAAYFVEAFVLGFLIGMTKLYIAVKPAIKAVSEFLGFKDTSLADGLDLAKKAGELIVPVVVGFVGALLAVGAAVGVVVAVSLAWTAAIYGMIAAVVAAAVWIEVQFVKALMAVWDFLAAAPGKMVQYGTDLILGLVSGISGAAGAVVDAVGGAVDGAILAAKKKLGIASPSKVFAEIGDNTGAGLVQGVEGATPDVQDAFANMVAPPDLPASALEAQDTPWGASVTPGAAASAKQVSDTGPTGDAAKGGKSGSDFSGATFNFYGVKDAEHAADLFEEAYTRLLEGDAASIAGEVAPV